MVKGRKSGALREAERRRRGNVRLADGESALAETVDDIFARLRSGAANVAGVSFQVNLAGLLLVGGRTRGSGLPPVIAVRPEGFEDIDCRLNDGSWLLVQSKQRGGGKPIGIAEIAEIIVHAAQVESAKDYDGSVSGFAIVTNGTFALSPTQWVSTIPSEEARLVRALRAKLFETGREPSLAENLISRTHLVAMDGSILNDIEAHLGSAFDIPPATSVIARSRLAAELAEVSAAQRGRQEATALLRTVAYLDSLIQDLRETVDVAALESALRDGVCEFVHFTRASADSEEQFFSGIRVVPSHIGSNRDVIRIPECEAVIGAVNSSNHVLIVGPSGTGKSALLWRAAAMLESGPMLIRVLRLESDMDVQSLLRYVNVLSPSGRRRVMICIDDLGRSSTERWPDARDRLLEMAGVFILGACRQEDLLPSIALGANIIDSRLTPASAARIYDRLRATGLTLRTEPEEAIMRADGLLMEFVAIATSGHRLREVLRSQVAALDAADDFLALEVLGVVTALHTLGRPVGAEDLPKLLQQPAALISRRLAKLRDEHLLITDDGMSWRALHDLRAEVILELLHENPPPTLAATYARSIRTAPVSSRPLLYRRAATRILRLTHLAKVPGATARLAAAHRALVPLVTSICEQIDERSISPTGHSAGEIVALVDAAERLDVAAYAAATLDFVVRQTPPTVDVSSYYLMAYSSRFSNLFTGNEMFTNLITIGRGLPEWDSTSRETVLERLSDVLIGQVLQSSDLHAAVRFSERLEGYRTISSTLAAHVFETHWKMCKTVPGMETADVMAQLVATLTKVADLRGKEVAATFGPVVDRATWAVASDPFGFATKVEFDDLISLPSSPSNLARKSTFSESSYCQVSARAFVRIGNDTVKRGYRGQAGQDSDSVNAQVVFLAQRLFDACPEADIVAAEVVFPNLSTELNGMTTDGQKQMRAGVVPRRVDTERSIAVQVAVTELLSSERWSDRCRRQASASADLIALLEELPARLSDLDNDRRRREWVALTESVAVSIARFPGLPFDLPLLENQTADLLQAADLDETYREAMRDPSKRALDLVAGCLLQVGQGLNDPSNLGGAGFRLVGAIKMLQEARRESVLPEFAGVGALLPEALDDLIWMGARILMALGRNLVASSQLRRSSKEDIETLTATIAHESASASVAALEQRLRDSNVDLQEVTIVPQDKPSDMLLNLEVLGAVGADSWAAADDSLGNWPATKREAASLVTKTTLVAYTSGMVIQIGTVIGGTTTPLYPVDPGDFPEIAKRLQLPLLAYDYQARADVLLRHLLIKSSEYVRNQSRPKSWKSVDSGEKLPVVVMEANDPLPWLGAVNAYLELGKHVCNQQLGQESLAATLTGLDLANPGSATPLLELVGQLRTSALEADLANSI